MANNIVVVAGSIVGIVAIIAVVMSMSGSGGNAQTANDSGAPDTIHQAIADVSASKAVLLDVRTPAEYASGHAKGSINFDVTRLQAGEMPSAAKSAKVYLYCHTGRRAGIAQGIMKQNGWGDVTNLGSFSNWQKADGPTGG
jgi:phage shock protein E